MCDKINPETCERALGSFLKGNEPKPQVMPILVAICECGGVYWARCENNTVWVMAEKDEADPTNDEISELQEGARKAWTQEAVGDTAN